MEPVTILLVEDNLQDIEMTRHAFAKGRLKNELVVVRNGEEALDYLYRRGKFKTPGSASRPGLILLDLHLPKVRGLDVLRQIKTDPDLRAIPAVVLTVSQRGQDIEESYALGASTYIQKPVLLDNFLPVVQSVKDYWVVIATLPQGQGAGSV